MKNKPIVYGLYSYAHKWQRPLDIVSHTYQQDTEKEKIYYDYYCYYVIEDGWVNKKMMIPLSVSVSLFTSCDYYFIRIIFSEVIIHRANTSA